MAPTFQTNDQARALSGLLGDDGFTLKVSADGSNFKTAMVVDKDDAQAFMTTNDGYVEADHNFFWGCQIP